MDGLSVVLKRKRDAEDRLRHSDASKNIIISEDGAGGQTVSDPSAALTVAVESLNDLIGAVDLVAGDNIIITLDGQTLIIAAADGVTTFTGLTDTPSAYTDAGSKFVAVKSTADGLEFVNAPSGGSGAFDWGSITVAAGAAQDWGSLA